MDDLDRMFRRLVQNIRTGYPDYLSRPFEVAELYQNIIPYRHNRSELGLEQNQDYEFALMRLLSGERGYLVVDEALREAMHRELASQNPDTSAFRAFSTAHLQLAPDAVRRLDQYLAGGAARPDDARLGRTAPRPAPGGPGEPMSAPMAAPAMPASPPMPPLPPMPAAAPPMPPLAPHPSAAAARAAGAAAATVQLPQGGAPVAPGYAAPPPPPPAPPARPPESPRQAAPAPAPRQPMREVPREPTREPMREPTREPGADAAHPGAAGGDAAEHSCRYCGGALPVGRRITFCPHCGQNLTVRHCPACSSELEIGWKFCITCGRSVSD